MPPPPGGGPNRPEDGRDGTVPPRRRGCLRRAFKIAAISIVVLVVVGIAALFFIDRRLNPSVDEPELVEVTLPTGPPLDAGRFVFDGDASGTFEIYTMAPDGSDVEQLTDDAEFDSWWARPSPDGTHILFYRTPAGTHDRDFEVTSLWMMASDGSGVTELLPPGSHGWNRHGHAEWSPDGEQLVMFAGKNTSPQIWLTDATGRNPRRLTDDGGTNVDPSWSPDGATIVYVGCPRRVCFPGDQEVYVVPSAGGDRERLTDDSIRDNDPYFAPDGGSIAFLSQTEGTDDTRVAGSWNIRILPDGAPSSAAKPDEMLGPVEMVTDDLEVNSMPKWVDDDTIVFHRFEYGSGRGFDLYEVDVGTSAMAPLLATDDAEEYPAPFRP